MSLVVSTTKGSTIETAFTIDNKTTIDGVRIGDYEMSLEEFTYMAVHFLSGGFFGWNGRTPEPINEALSNLFATYKQVGGAWVRPTSLTISELTKK